MCKCIGSRALGTMYLYLFCFAVPLFKLNITIQLAQIFILKTVAIEISIRKKLILVWCLFVACSSELSLCVVVYYFFLHTFCPNAFLFVGLFLLFLLLLLWLCIDVKYTPSYHTYIHILYEYI